MYDTRLDSDEEDFLRTFVLGMHDRATSEQDGWESWYDAAEKEYGERYRVINDHWKEVKND